MRTVQAFYARALLFAVCAGVSMLARASESLQNPSDFCNRSPEMRQALEKATKLPCQKITVDTFRTVTDVDVTLKAPILRPGDLAGLYHLISMDLNIGSAREIPADFFHDLGQLRDFDLTAKKLVQIDRRLLAPLKSVRGLKLRTPLLHALPDGLFSDLTQLVSINLEEVPLKTMEATPFANSSILNQLALPHEFEKIPDTIFKGTHAESVSIGTKSAVSAKVFRDAPYLDTVDLYADYRQLHLDDGHLFPTAKQKPNWIYLHGKNLAALPTQVFEELKTAKQIDLFATVHDLKHSAGTLLGANGFTCENIFGREPHLMCLNWYQLHGESATVIRH